ncbi:MAG: 4Fe-4S dicluster domain-containing protein [Calditrichaeota bacterium]|nr:MAG: 4Fe-4S dicluster domain-containing protein [Calditrichota bacterium]
MPRWGMVIDLDKCTGCGACVAACKQENNVAYNTPEEAERGRTLSWINIMTEVEGEYPHLRVRYLPLPCMHCDNPPCIKVCPVRATYKADNGIVAQIYPRCIGCRYCMAACPYTVKDFNWFEPQWDPEIKKTTNPDVSLRPKGVVEKCTFCHHRLIKAREQAALEGREMLEEEYQPACVETCPANAMFFGDLDDPNSIVARLSRSPRAFRLMEDLGTEPKVYYLSEGEKII